METKKEKMDLLIKKANESKVSKVPPFLVAAAKVALNKNDIIGYACIVEYDTLEDAIRKYIRWIEMVYNFEKFVIRIDLMNCLGEIIISEYPQNQLVNLKNKN